MEDFDKTPIESVGEALQPFRLKELKEATLSTNLDAAKYILPTIYRHNEFAWLKRLGIELKRILHIEQEYEYFSFQSEGENPIIRTKIVSLKERSTFTIIVFESEIITNGKTNIISKTTFWAKKNVE